MSNTKEKMVLRDLLLLFIFVAFMALPIAIAQEVPAHVVISAVYPDAVNESASEWIELYNPTEADINIGGWTIDTATYISDATITAGATIPAHGFYLIADAGFSTGKDNLSWPDADLEDEIALRNGDGWCRLNNSGSIVDTVGWGTATTNETQNAAKPAQGESIERKSLNGGYAPAQDTDDNSFDFFVQGTPTPKNSASSKMDPAPVVSSGEVVQLTGPQTEDIVWNESNFGGFCYDLGDNACIGTETLTIAAGTLEGPNIDRTIDENNLTYTTSTIPREYELHKNEGLTLDGDSNYSIEFWRGKRYVAIASKANKLAKPLVEFEGDDKKTLATGEEWGLGGGFSLAANQIDLEGDKVWFSLQKDGRELDNEVCAVHDVYTYTEDAAGEEDIPIFSCYVDAIFRGTDTNIVQVKYVFLIDNEILEIEVDVVYDNMKVATASASDIVLKNHLEIDLLPSTTALIMGNLFFKTTENRSAIEFYPCLVGEGEPPTPKITSFAPPPPVNDTVCNWRTFNVSVDQTVDVSWYLNNTLQHTNVGTKEASYTLHAEVVGEHNVSAIATNENGTDMQTWVWNVTAAPEPVLEINKTGVPDPVSPGGTLNYSIRVNNSGNATATNVTVTETYDENVAFVCCACTFFR